MSSHATPATLRLRRGKFARSQKPNRMAAVRAVALVASFALVWISTVARTAAAHCPFCPPSIPPMAEQVAAADVVLLTKWSRNSASDAAPDSEDGPEFLPEGSSSDQPLQSASTTFIVLQQVKGRKGEFPAGCEVSVSYLHQGQPGDLCLLLAARDGEKLAWGQTVEVTELSSQYILQAPSTERPTPQRLLYFLKFLESSDPLIANDAFAEFSRAKYDDVASIAASLPRDKIRKWLQSVETPTMRIGFYGMLLGLCGEASDAPLLSEKILLTPRADEVRLGIDGWMGGWLLLDGETALRTLVERKLDDRTQPDAEAHAVLSAVRFVAEYAPRRIPRPALVAAARKLLNRPALAELVVPDLARWKDWDSLPELIARDGQPPFDEPAARQSLIRFAQACLKARGDQTASPDLQRQAGEFLTRPAADPALPGADQPARKISQP